MIHRIWSSLTPCHVKVIFRVCALCSVLQDVQIDNINIQYFTSKLRVCMHLIFTMLESRDESNPFVGISCCLCYKLWNFYEAFPPLIYGECYQTLPLPLLAAAAPHLKSSNFQEPKPLMWERIKYDDRFRKVFTKFSIRILFSTKKTFKSILSGQSWGTR